MINGLRDTIDCSLLGPLDRDRTVKDLPYAPEEPTGEERKPKGVRLARLVPVLVDLLKRRPMTTTEILGQLSIRGLYEIESSMVGKTLRALCLAGGVVTEQEWVRGTCSGGAAWSTKRHTATATIEEAARRVLCK